MMVCGGYDAAAASAAGVDVEVQFLPGVRFCLSLRILTC